ncbi:efflux transporter outer membrane subunit [Flavihumibacter solisilvae]|uniref:RND transporter n=1 Tax=Flavihumibacter solisilvae TaxID=1349421 RepID=A0A0C1IZC1_9BACT|nr:efflux transporter outer membrane subunit [Flavihumibacter solisilvae]KIC95854.1 RND transporter [Flavihumibacter solisilvae]
MLIRFINRKINLIMLAVLFISACKVGQNYSQPDLKLPESFSDSRLSDTAGKSFSDTSSIANLEWKRFFSDTVLVSLIDKGLRYNNDLLIALRRIDVAQQQVRQSKALWYPEVNLQVTGQYNHPSKNSLNGVSANSFLGKSHIENYLVAVNLSWEIDIWGKISRQKEAALAEYVRTNEAAKAIQTQLVAGIAQGYYNLLMLDLQKDITMRNIRIRDSFLVATKLLRNAGVTTTLAVQQAESQKQSAELLIPVLEQDIALQENALQVLTGQYPGAVSRNASLNSFDLSIDLSAGLPVALVSRRPDVRAEEMALVVANSQVGIAQANMYPALNISAGGGLESFKASNWFNMPGSLFGIAAGTIAQPVFQRRALKTAYEVAKLEREQAVLRFRQTVLVATTEVSDALVRVDKLKEQRLIAGAQTDTLNRAVDNAQLLFRSDMANYLEVLNAQGSALLAELNLAQVQRQQVSAVVDLYRALGGGWK